MIKINKIYNEDFFDLCNDMKGMADLIITSPPGYHTNTDRFDYMEFVDELVDKLIYISKDNSVIVYCVTDQYIDDFVFDKQYLVSFCFYKKGYKLIDKKLWFKVPYRDKGFTHATFLFFVKDKYIDNGFTIENSFEYSEYQFIDAFPSALIKSIILKYSHDNDLIIDPFMGFGEVPIQSKLLNRNYIGIELDADKYITAEERLKGELI